MTAGENAKPLDPQPDTTVPLSGPTAFCSPTLPPMRSLSLFALALVLPLAACESEPDVAEPADVDAVVVDPVDDPMADPMTDPATDAEVTPAGTVEAVQGAGGLLQLSMDAAINNINGWITRLEGNPDFAPVVEDLEALRAELQEPEIDGAAVGALLTDLGSATTEAAAGDGDLQALGEALSAAGNELTGI